jgi:diguanylate cyclase (GGDEF)-like protein
MAAVIGSGLVSEAVALRLTDASAIVAALAAAVVIIRAATRDTAHRRAWSLLGTAVALWGLGEVVWGFHEVVQGDVVPFPSVADIAYLGAVPFAVAGVLGFSRGDGARFQARTVLDGCLVAGSLLFVAWALVLGPAWRATTAGPWEHAISVAYPLTDLVLAATALVIVSWGTTTERPVLHVVAGALLVMAATDTAFTWLTTNGSFSSSNPISILWPVSYLLLAFATTRTGRGQLHARRSDGDPWSLFGPYLPVLAALAVAVPRVVGGRSMGPFLTLNGAVLVVLILARQAMTAWDLRTTVAALHERERELARLASTDPLTGLANRSSFTSRLEQATSTPGAEPAVVYIDLDGFKLVNDRFGHAVGDRLLVVVSRRLESCLEPGMVLARIGGDEFVVLVDGHDEAVGLARRVLEAFELPFDHEGASVPFQASLGIATAPAGAAPEEVVRRADAAMYVAKTSGKGRAVDYPDDQLCVAR